MKDRTMEAICAAEYYFCNVIEKEACLKPVPSRTEELYYAVKGLKGICAVKQHQILKEGLMEDKVSHHDMSKLLAR